MRYGLFLPENRLILRASSQEFLHICVTHLSKMREEDEKGEQG